MGVIAVVIRTSAIDSILEHLGLASDTSSLKPLRGPPVETAVCIEPSDAIDYPPHDEFPA
jgi:hypothetical protein